MILTVFGVLSRLGAIASAIIVIGLNGKFIQNASWNSELMIYIEVLAGVTVFAALIPPYPNFLYDLFAGLAWALAALFALIVQFLESSCYGFRLDPGINCPAYTAGTAFAFIAAISWLASAFFGALRILGVIFNIQSSRDRPMYVGASLEGGKKQKERATGDDESEEHTPIARKKNVKGFGNSHIAKYFICYGLLAVALLAAGLPLLIIYAAPAFGLYLVEGIPIPDVNITLLDPKNDTIQFSVFTRVRVPDTLKVELEPMNVSFFLPDTRADPVPFASVNLVEKLSYGSKERITLEHQQLKLENLDEFSRLVEQVAYNPTFVVAGSAKARVSIGEIHTSVDLYKQVELAGFNNFVGLDIKEFGIQKADADGYNVYGKAIVDNPSPASVTLGQVTLAVIIANVTLGEAVVQVDNIVPGNNTFDVKAKIFTENVEKGVKDVLRAEIPYLKDELVMASATGVSVIYEGEHLPYWEKAFQSIQISATRPIRPLLHDVINSGIGLLLGSDEPIGILQGLVDDLLDTILSTIKALPEADTDEYSESLGNVAELLIQLLKMLGFI